MDPSSVDEQLPPFGLDEFEKRSVEGDGAAACEEGHRGW